MNARREESGPNKHSEKQAVYTTIVGGRPPGCGTDVGAIPRGIEVLVKKASLDPQFREILLQSHAVAANEIGLQLTPAEEAVLANIPRKQLEAIISHAKVAPESRRAFLGKAASVMLAALGAQPLACRKSKEQHTEPAASGLQASPNLGQRSPFGDEDPNGPTFIFGPGVSGKSVKPAVLAGIRSDPPVRFGIQPDRPATIRPGRMVVRGIEPDYPPTTGHTPSGPRSEDSRKTVRSRQYVVREGDSLWRIAAEQLGDGRRYKEIMALNRDVLKDEDNLTVGMQLNIPAY